jgi:hypothetical protein
MKSDTYVMLAEEVWIEEVLRLVKTRCRRGVLMAKQLPGSDPFNSHLPATLTADFCKPSHINRI